MATHRQSPVKSWLVLNISTAGYKRFKTESEANSLASKWPQQMRLIPLYGDFEVNDEFIDFCCWAAA